MTTTDEKPAVHCCADRAGPDKRCEIHHADPDKPCFVLRDQCLGCYGKGKHTHGMLAARGGESVVEPFGLWPGDIRSPGLVDGANPDTSCAACRDGRHRECLGGLPGFGCDCFDLHR